MGEFVNGFLEVLLPTAVSCICSGGWNLSPMDTGGGIGDGWVGNYHIFAINICGGCLYPTERKGIWNTYVMFLKKKTLSNNKYSLKIQGFFMTGCISLCKTVTVLYWLITMLIGPLN